MIGKKWWRGLGGAWLAMLAGLHACQSGDSNDESETRAQGPCTRDADCTADRPICDLQTLLCIECAFDSECTSDEVCFNGQCQPSCTNSRECASDRICDAELEVCVECARDADCADEQICAGNQCRTTCDSDRDCRALDLLCAVEVGFCVACQSTTDCSEDQYCSDGVCQLQNCVPGASSCEGDVRIVCDSDGSRFYMQPCFERCTLRGDRAECEESDPPVVPPVGQGGSSASGGSGGFAFGGTGGFASGGSGGSSGSSGSKGLAGGAGRGGFAGSGGVSGAGGSAPGGAGGDAGDGGDNGECPNASATAGIIDDLEDGDHFISLQAPFQGYWFVFNDGLGSQSPMPDAFGDNPFPPTPDGNGFSACTTGSGFSAWGAGIGFNLLDFGAAGLCPVTADRVNGVRFKIKTTTDARLHVAIQSSTSVVAGGTCTASVGCGFQPSAPIPVSDEWTQFSVLWRTLLPGATAFAPDELLGFQFVTGFEGEPFELCVDDIEFF